MSIVVDRGLGIVDELYPSVFYAIDVDEQSAPVVEGNGLSGKDLRRRVKALVGIASISSGEQIFHGVIDAIVQIGDGIAELFKDGDAGIAGVVVGP